MISVSGRKDQKQKNAYVAHLKQTQSSLSKLYFANSVGIIFFLHKATHLHTSAI